MTPEETDRCLQSAADRFGTPAFVYFTEQIDERIALLRRTLGQWFSLSFAVKSNPNPALLGWLNGRIDHLDISSIGELRLALDAGWNPDRLSYTGPGKREGDLREAIASGVGLLVLESLREAKLADAAARSLGKVQPVLVRISPDTVPKGFGDQLAGNPTPFGIDLEDADEALKQICVLPNLGLSGLHIYSGTQCLKPAAIAENYRNFISIFEALCDAHGLSPSTLIFGAGLGIAYHEHDTPLDPAEIADDIALDLDRFTGMAPFRESRLVLELGRYLVAEAGYFLTRVISTKQSRGKRIAICDGGMNNHLPACGLFGMVMRRNYLMHKVGGGKSDETVDLVGPLCTTIDRIASAVNLPHLDEGDLIAIHNSGAYGLTASPIHFISHAPPAELMVEEGRVLDVSRSFDCLPPVGEVFRRRASGAG